MQDAYSNGGVDLADAAAVACIFCATVLSFTAYTVDSAVLLYAIPT